MIPLTTLRLRLRNPFSFLLADTLPPGWTAAGPCFRPFLSTSRGRPSVRPATAPSPASASSTLARCRPLCRPTPHQCDALHSASPDPITCGSVLVGSHPVVFMQKITWDHSVFAGAAQFGLLKIGPFLGDKS